MLERNNLYPIFLKTTNLNILIVGGGKVALEKLTFLLKSSPDAKVKIVAVTFNQEIRSLANKYQIELVEKPYGYQYLEAKNVVIGATNDIVVNKQIYQDAKAKNVLVNIADTPELCDFYLGGIVTKGNVKIAISTNGKSPTMAKRLRQFFEEILPEEIDDLVSYLNKYRKTLKNDFEFKVKTLNEMTRKIIEN